MTETACVVLAVAAAHLLPNHYDSVETAGQVLNWLALLKDTKCSINIGIEFVFNVVDPHAFVQSTFFLYEGESGSLS